MLVWTPATTIGWAWTISGNVPCINKNPYVIDDCYYCADCQLLRWSSAVSCIVVIASVIMILFYGFNFYMVCCKEAKIDAVRLIGFNIIAIGNALAHAIMAYYFAEYSLYGWWGTYGLYYGNLNLCTMKKFVFRVGSVLSNIELMDGKL